MRFERLFVLKRILQLYYELSEAWNERPYRGPTQMSLGRTLCNEISETTEGHRSDRGFRLTCALVPLTLVRD